jgi:EAL and modified HD-GYP domain-containing signal transduction protein
MTREKFFLGRQPILDVNQEILGYELLFRSAESLLSANVQDYLFASASVILNALSDFGIQGVLGRHKGFFNLDTQMLLSDLVELLPKNQVVLELLEYVPVTDEIVARCRQLKNEGFVLALDDNLFTEEFEPLYELADIVKVDILQVPDDELPAMVNKFRKWPVQLLAEKVENLEQFELCRKLGFELFQGYFFAHPVVLKQNRVDTSQMTLSRLLNLVMADADIKEIEETFKHNPNLTYNLLKLVNSVAMGCREKIKTLRHAIMVVGMQQLKRWIILALFAYQDSRGITSPLLEMAACRGRFMELLVKSIPFGGGDRELPEKAFMVGVLSLLDVLFEVPIAEIINQLNLTDDIRSAILTRDGLLGTILLLTERLEHSDFKGTLPLLEKSRLSMDSLLTCQIETINWSSGLTAMA